MRNGGKEYWSKSRRLNGHSSQDNHNSHTTMITVLELYMILNMFRNEIKGLKNIRTVAALHTTNAI